VLVERGAYLLERARYVVLNPVRAGMVRDAKDWPWSSYRAMLGQELAPAWLKTDWLLGQFDRERSRAQAGYTSFVGQGVGQPSIWEALRHQVFLGSEAFVERNRGLSQASAAASRSSTRPAPAPGQVSRGLRPPLPRPARCHGAGIPDRRLLHAGNRQLLRRT